MRVSGLKGKIFVERKCLRIFSSLILISILWEKTFELFSFGFVTLNRETFFHLRLKGHFVVARALDRFIGFGFEHLLLGVGVAILSSHRCAVERRQCVGAVIHRVLLGSLDGAWILILRLHHRNLPGCVIDETGVCDVAGSLLTGHPVAVLHHRTADHVGAHSTWWAS